MTPDDVLTGLPGEGLIRQGLADSSAGRRTLHALLVDVARPRLTGAGLLRAETPRASAEPELELYQLLLNEGGDAYSRYNSLLRELASFEAALDHRLARGRIRG